MFIRLFANSTSEDEAISVYKNINCIIESKIKIEEIKKVEPYWKIDDIYVVEAEIEFINALGEEPLKEFLYSIADNWQFFGNPTDEALASFEDAGDYIKHGVRMINIFY